MLPVRQMPKARNNDAFPSPIAFKAYGSKRRSGSLSLLTGLCLKEACRSILIIPGTHFLSRLL